MAEHKVLHIKLTMFTSAQYLSLDAQHMSIQYDTFANVSRITAATAVVLLPTSNHMKIMSLVQTGQVTVVL